MSLLDLPKDIHLLINSYLPHKSTRALRLTSRLFYFRLMSMYKVYDPNIHDKSRILGINIKCNGDKHKKCLIQIDGIMTYKYCSDLYHTMEAIKWKKLVHLETTYTTIHGIPMKGMERVFELCNEDELSKLMEEHRKIK